MAKFLNADGLLYLWRILKEVFVQKEAGKGLFSGRYEDLENKPVLPVVPSHVGAFENDVHYQTKQQVTDMLSEAADYISDSVLSMDYQTGAQVEASILAKGYQTAADIDALLSVKDYQTGEEVNLAVMTAVAQAGNLKREIVTALPSAADANTHTIYMVSVENSKENNQYAEWMFLNGAWELIGSSEVDLTDYLKEGDILPITNEEIDALLAML